MALGEKIDEVVGKLEKGTDELTAKAKAKLDEKLTDEKKAEYKQKFDDVVSGLEKGTDELTAKAKAKIDEKLTDEKKAEYKQKFDETVNNAGDEFSRFGESLGKDVKNMFGGKKD